MQRNQKLIEKLEGLKKTASTAIGAQGEAVIPKLDAMIEMEKRDQTDPVMIERAKQLDALRSAALQGTQYTYAEATALPDGTVRDKGQMVDARAEVSKIQVMKINNFVYAQSSALSFFESKNFADNEVPFYQNETGFEVSLCLAGIDGGIRSRSGGIVPSQSQYQLPGPFGLTTEVSKYKLIDPLRGNIADESLALIDQSRDWTLNFDARLWAILQTNRATKNTGNPQNFSTVAPFDFTNVKKEKRTFNLHSTIDSANLPQSNDLDSKPGGGRSGYIDKATLDAIVLYSRRLSGLSWGPIQPMEIFFPSAIDLQVVTSITQSTNDGTSSISKQIVTSGTIGELYGQKFGYRPLPTLPANSKYCYVRFNMPVGLVGFKPGLDQTFNNRYPEKNIGELSMQKWWTWAIAEQHRPFMVRVRFKD